MLYSTYNLNSCSCLLQFFFGSHIFISMDAVSYLCEAWSAGMIVVHFLDIFREYNAFSYVQCSVGA